MQGINRLGVAVPAGASAQQPKNSSAAIEDAVHQFEALLIAQLLKSARGDGEGWLGSGDDQTASSAMELSEEAFAEALSARGGLGLASLIASGLAAPVSPIRSSASPAAEGR